MKIFKVILILHFILIVLGIVLSVIFFLTGIDESGSIVNELIKNLSVSKDSILNAIIDFGYAGVLFVISFVLGILYLPLSFIYIILSKNKSLEAPKYAKLLK